MGKLTYTTKCGHYGSIWTRDRGFWQWDVQGPTVRHHNDEAEGQQIYVKMAIAHYLSIPIQTIRIQKGSASKYHKRRAASAHPVRIKKNSPRKNKSNGTVDLTRDEALAREILKRIHRGSPSRSRKGRPPVPIELSDSDDNDSYHSYARSGDEVAAEEIIKRIQRKRKSPTRTPSPRKETAPPSPRPSPKSTDLGKPKLECSPSRRARCQVCERRIPKGVLRVGTVSVWKGSIHHNQYYHPECCPDDLKKSLFPDDCPKQDSGKFWDDKRDEMDKFQMQRQHTIEVERRELRQSLRKLRLKLHEEQGAKDGPALIISLSTIDNIVYSQPTTKTALLNVRGIGKQMLELYGRALLKEVRAYVSNQEMSENEEESNEEQSQGTKRSRVEAPSDEEAPNKCNGTIQSDDETPNTCNTTEPPTKGKSSEEGALAKDHSGSGGSDSIIETVLV